MSGVSTLRFGDDSGTGGGSGGTLGPLSWNNIYGPPGTRFATTNTLTISGITGSLVLQMSVTGIGLGAPILNGTPPPWDWPPGPWDVTVANGDTLAWAINNFGIGVDASGTATIKRLDTGATIDTFTYFVQY